MIEIITLGQCTILSDGKPISVGSRKSVALLMYMVYQAGEFVGREHLTGLLWENSEPTRARHSLSQALYALRKQLPELPLISERDKLHLTMTGIHSDIADLQSALDEQRLEDAIKLYKGDFLEGFWIDNAATFERWQDSQSVKIRQMLSRALQHGMNEAEQAGDWPRTERLARGTLRLNFFDESACCTLLKAFAAAGDRLGALAEYEVIRDRFLAELERAPGPELVALVERLHDISVPEIDHHEDGPSRPEIPFVGRDDEFQRVITNWEDVKGGAGRTLLVVGEAGIGKTRLCEHFLGLANVENTRIFQGRCYAAESQLPYAAVADALSGGVRPEDLMALPPAWCSILSELLPELISEFESSYFHRESEGARRRLFEAVARVLEGISERSVIVFYLDDFHWADESTTEMVHYLGRRLRQHRVIFLLSLRREDVPNNSKVADLLRNTPVEEHLRELTIFPLDGPRALKLLKGYIDLHSLELPDSVAQQIVKQTAGRPFFILEVLQAIQRGEIELGSEDAASAARPTVLLPPSAELFLSSRLAELDRTARELTGVLAVLGRKTDPAIVRSIGGFPPEQFLHDMDKLVARRILRDSDAAVEFTHDLIREAAYRSLSAMHRKILHARAAETFAKLNPENPGIVAVHHDLAGNSEEAYQTSLEAANAAADIYAYNEVVLFLRMAIPNAPSSATRFEIKHRLAGVLYQNQRYADADDLFLVLEHHYKEAGIDSRLIEVQSKRTIMAVQRGSLPADKLAARMRTLMRSAQKLDNENVFVELLVWFAALGHAASRRDWALEAASQLIGISETDSPAGLEATIHAAFTVSMWDNIRIGARLADRAVELAEENSVDFAIAKALNARAANAVLSGRLVAARQDIDRSINISRARVFWIQLHTALNTLGVVLLEHGAYEKAEVTLHKAKQLADVAEGQSVLLNIHDNLMYVTFELGRFDKTTAIAKNTLRIVEDFPWHSAVVAISMLGLCSLERGNLAAARDYRSKLIAHAGNRDLWITDCSYIEMFIARMSEVMGESDKAIERLGEAIAAYENRDVLCRSRMRLERARLRIDLEPSAAREEAQDVRQQAAQWGARPLVDKADRVLDRLALHAREGR